jgi:hypothetical protein
MTNNLVNISAGESSHVKNTQINTCNHSTCNNNNEEGTGIQSNRCQDESSCTNSGVNSHNTCLNSSSCSNSGEGNTNSCQNGAVCDNSGTLI